MVGNLKNGNATGKFDVLTFLINVYFLMSYLSLFSPDLRYMKYSLPVIGWFFYMNRTAGTESPSIVIARKYLTEFLKLYCAIFLFYFFVQLLTGTITTRYFANCLFVLLPLLFMYVLLPFIKIEKIRFYFLYISFGTILGYVLEKQSSIFETLLNWQQLLAGIEDSTVSSESNLYPFLLAFTLVFACFYKLQWKYIFVLLVFMLLGFKRIVIFGVISFLALNMFPRLYDHIILRPRRFSYIFAFIVSVIIMTYYYVANGVFDDFLFNTFGLYTNAFLQGRQELYRLVIDKLNDSNFILGSGIGSVDDVLLTYRVQISNITNLHSELLRWFLEVGGILYFIWMYKFFLNSLSTRFNMLLFLFLFIILLTDNVFIYFDCMFYIYLLSVFSIIIDNHKNNELLISRLD